MSVWMDEKFKRFYYHLLNIFNFLVVVVAVASRLSVLGGDTVTHLTHTATTAVQGTKKPGMKKEIDNIKG